ncbi:hypothetical protein PG996_006419 [Apiospora saccharicola]|uniref:Uncharacterized protein n=1 Tax=Apiospora saccharicola TaxID=335842 RepID=A0ABR1VS15_9PEZI
MSTVTEVKLDDAEEQPVATLNFPVGVVDDAGEKSGSALELSHLGSETHEDEPNGFSQSLQLTIEGETGGGQLSAPPCTNRPDELSIPRRVISAAVSSSIFRSECLRPVFAGTYNGVPAYLVRLQFQLVAATGRNSKDWLSRVKGATIKVLFKDAPPPDDGNESNDSNSDDDDDDDEEPHHPSIVKTMPGPEGWKDRPTTAQVVDNAELSLQLGWDAAGVSATKGRQRTKTETGAIQIDVACLGHDDNSLVVSVAEDPVDAGGIPKHLVLPLIVTIPPQKRGRGKGRRFSMRVEVNARFGFWRRGVLADIVPVLGRADEPLYFDPGTMRQWMEEGQTGVGGIKVVEWRGELEEVNLEEYFSPAKLAGPG